MPSQPACFHRLEEIFTALRAMTSTRLDRLAVEKLFRVPQRRARWCPRLWRPRCGGGKLYLIEAMDYREIDRLAACLPSGS